METGHHSYNEKLLFLQIAEGDENAFRQLFDLCLPRLQKVVFQVVQSEPATRDIIQEVFIACWLNRDKLPEIEIPMNWLYRIAYNQCFRYLRNKQLRERTLAKAKESGPALALPETEMAVDHTELNRLVQLAIHRLPEQRQKIFRMNRQQGIKPADIATALNISTQAVRNSLTRSVKSIRNYLTEQGYIIPLFIFHFFLEK